MLNHIVIMGRLTRDPELRYTANNVPVASFTIACDRDAKTKDGERETDFINCVAWRQLGEFVNKYFRKGNVATVSGRLQIRAYLDKNENKRDFAEVNADNIYFGESKSKEVSVSASDKLNDLGNRYAGAVQFVEVEEEGELPF